MDTLVPLDSHDSSVGFRGGTGAPVGTIQASGVVFMAGGWTSNKILNEQRVYP